MNLSVSLARLQEIYNHSGSRQDTLNLVVRVHQPEAIGSTPCVAIASIQAGIDWDAGKVLLTADRQLTVLSPEDVAAINQSVKAGQSWHAYEAHKKMRARIAELESQLAALRNKVDPVKKAAQANERVK